MESLILVFIFFLGMLFSWLLLQKFYIPAQYISQGKYNAIDKEKYLVENQLNLKLHEYQKLEQEYLVLLKNERQIAERYILSQRETDDLKDKLKNQEKDLELVHLKMREQFELLAQNIIQKNSENITRLNQEKIGLILNPLKEKIESFEKKVEENQRAQYVESNVLKSEIKRLSELNIQISEDARNLTMALKGDNKIQGNWGEIVLERILENSGLTKGSEYIIQGTEMKLFNEDGNLQKPDVIIQLPDEKHIIIDSKVSLKAYDDFTSCSSEEEKAEYLKMHINSLKQHIRLLGSKYYQSLSALKTPDFVLLFLPIEACFSIAFQFKNFDLFSYAWERKVVIVSPTTLLATLRTVASIWKYEKQNKNALKIAEESGKIYDKLFCFVEDLEKIGKNINHTQQSYEEATKKLYQGRGNILERAEKLKSLGIVTKKTLNGEINFNRLAEPISSGEEDK